MADKIPTFEWNSEESGKKDFHVFEAALQSHLATRQCRFVLDNNAIAINTPINPGPEPLVLWMPENGGNYTKYSG